LGRLRSDPCDLWGCLLQVLVECSYLEIYNEKLRDLLGDGTGELKV